MDAMPIDENSPDFVTALARGLAVLRCFGPDSRELTLSQVAARMDLNRATARRFLLTLESLGYVRADGRRFSLTARVLDLGYTFLSSLDLREMAQPVLKSIVEDLGEACSLSVFDYPDVVYIAQVPPRHLMYVPVSVGRRLPAYSTAMGRVLLAGLTPAELDAYFADVPRQRHTPHTVVAERTLRRLLAGVRADGYALADQEYVDGARAIAVPVTGADGRITAALNVSAHANRVTKQEMVGRFLPVLRKGAAAIARGKSG